MSFRAKIIAGMMIPQIIVWAVMTHLHTDALRRTAREGLADRAVNAARLIAASGKDAMISRDFATLAAIATEAVADSAVRQLRFVDERHDVLAAAGFTNQEPDDVTLDQPVTIAGQEFGRVELTFDGSSVTAATRASIETSAMVALAGAALTTLMAWVLGARLASRVEALREAGDKLAAGALDTRVEDTSGDELGGLGAAFNTMAERLRATMDALADDARDIKTRAEAASDWYWETDADHQFTWLSPSFETVTGVPAQAVLGRTRFEIGVAGAVDAQAWSDHQRVLKDRRSFRDFRYWIGQGADARWVSVSGSPRFEESGEFKGYHGRGDDVTAQAETATRITLLSRIVEQLPMAVLVTDPQRRIEYVNPHYERVTGYTVDEVVGHSPAIFASGEMAPSVYAELWGTILDKRPWHGELLNRRKNGETYWEASIIFPIIDDRGAIAHFVGIKEDVSERKRVEAALAERTWLARRHHESLRALSEIAAHPGIDAAAQFNAALTLGARHLALPVGIISHVEGEVYTVSHHVAPPELGLANGAVFELGNTWCSLTLREDDVVAIAHAKESPHVDHPCREKFGLEAYIGAPVVVAGVRVGTVNFSAPWPYQRAFDSGDLEFMRLLARWVGATMERDDARRAIAVKARELAEINTELERFAYVASHDLRQPLRAITSYLGLLRRALGAELTGDNREFLDFALDGAKRMDRMITDLLEYSRTGRHSAPFEKLDLGEILSDTLVTVSTAIIDADAVITHANDWPVVMGSRSEMGRLFQNLIGNALKYRSADRPCRVHLNHRRDGGFHEITITDNGIGIAPSDRDRAFQIFQRLVARDAYEGSGIGLAVCKKIVEGHGGRVWIADGADGGTAIVFTLPVITGSPPADV